MIGAYMKHQVITVPPEMTVYQAVQLVRAKRIGTLPVVNAQGAFIGVVRLEDLLRVFMPDFVSLMEDIDFVHDFGVIEHLDLKDVPEVGRLTMRHIMKPPVSVEQTSGALRAFAVASKHQMRDLPVVDEKGRLVGIASHVDIATAFLSGLSDQQEDG